MPIIHGPVGNPSTNTHYRYGPPRRSYQDVRNRSDEIKELVVDYKVAVNARDGRPLKEVDKIGCLCSLIEFSDN